MLTSEGVSVRADAVSSNNDIACDPACSIYFDANRRCCARTGCSSSWTTAPVASSGLACIEGSWTVWRCAGCLIARHGATPRRPTLSSDHDPLYRFHQWRANLRILDVKEIKTVPYVPLSHPFVERLIGPFGANVWIARCSGRPLISRRSSSISNGTFNEYRTHAGLDGRPPEPSTDAGGGANISSFRWRAHCRGLYQTPVAA